MKTASIVGALMVALALGGAATAPAKTTAFPGKNGLIVFQRGGQCALFVMNGDGSAQHQITDACDTSAVWSPSGRRIAFQRGGEDDFAADVYTVNPNGTALERVTFTNGFDGDPSWSPDAGRIAFESRRTNNTDVWSAAAGGGSERQLTNEPGFDGDPAWSPGGSRIAFTSNRSGDYEVYVMNTDGSGVTRLTNSPGLDQNPSWSPDGRRIVFDSMRAGTLDVWVMNADGTGPSNLTDHPALDALAVFSPDGTKIAFVSDRGGDRDIYTMPAGGGSPTRLTSTSGDEMTPDWGPQAAAGGGGGGAIRGTNGPDQIIGTIGPDTIYGLKGNDALYGRAGNDRLFGGAGRDRLYGEAGKDQLDGGDGSDRIDGGPGADVLVAGFGNDLLYARDRSRDIVKGGPGLDKAFVDRLDRTVGVEIVVRPRLLVGRSEAGRSAPSPSTKLQKQDRVYGGGQFGPGCFSNSSICFANPRNFSVDAHAAGDGTDAAGESEYGTPGINESSRSVRCLRVDGNSAVIGGVVATGANAGWGYVQYFVDRGGPGLGDRDLASPSLIDPLDATTWPAGFPDVCPSPTAGWPAAGPPVYREVDEGDVVVRDAPTD